MSSQRKGKRSSIYNQSINPHKSREAEQKEIDNKNILNGKIKSPKC